jgi:hypothetical protein
MYVIFDWMTLNLVVVEGTDKVLTFDSEDEAEAYQTENLDPELSTILKAPSHAAAYLS